VVIKYNSNQRYATNSSTAFVIKEIAKRRNIPIQEVMVRNDTACGSTIGPIVASGLGIRTVGECLEIAKKEDVADFLFISSSTQILAPLS